MGRASSPPIKGYRRSSWTQVPHASRAGESQHAPTDAVEAAGASGAPPSNVTIAVEGTADGPVHLVDFDLPDRGRYIVRATLTWLLEDGSVGRDVRLWRLWTDAAEFYPDVPHPDPVAPCGAPDLAQPAPPALTMALDGNEVATGVRMNGRWNGTLAAGGPKEVPADVVQLPSGTGLALETAGDVCAMAWTVTYGPVPATLDCSSRPADARAPGQSIDGSGVCP